MRTRPALLALVIVGFVACSATTEGSTDGNATTTKSPLTGDPQKDYIYDPNLPFQLRGYNLSDYPFYESMPTDITFKCDGLKDGFYASIPHKCQVYHHCLFGVRYDFLCANFTAFDQKNFICHFVSEVDCEGSEKYWNRNDALYKPASTTTTTTSGPPERVRAKIADRPNRRQRPLRRRPFRRRRPVYDDYYYDDYYSYDDYDQYYDQYYDYDGKGRRKGGRRRAQSGSPKVEPIVQRDPSDTSRKGLFSRPRPAPLIKPPVPINVKPTEQPTTTKKSVPIDLGDIPFDDAPIPINENLVRDLEFEQTSPDERPRKSRPQAERVPEKVPNYRRYPGRNGVRTTTEPPTEAPPPPVEEKEFDEYEDYPDDLPKRPLRRNPHFRQRRPGGFRRRRPYLQRSRHRPQEYTYPDTEGAASFTQADAPVKRVRGGQRHRETPRYKEQEVPQYDEPEQHNEETSPRRKSPYIAPPRRLQSRPHENKPPPPTSPRDRFPSRRPPPSGKPILEQEENPIEYEEQLPIEEAPNISPPQSSGGERSRPLYPRSRSRLRFQEPQSQDRPQEKSEGFHRNHRNFVPGNNRDEQRGNNPTNQALTKGPVQHKEGTSIRIEDIVFEEIGIGHPVANVRPGTFPLSPIQGQTTEKKLDMLDQMPVDDLGKFSPAINKRPLKMRVTPVKLQHEFRHTSRNRRPFQEPQEHPVRDKQRPQENVQDIMDRPAPQVPRNRSQFPVASIFQNTNGRRPHLEDEQHSQDSSISEPIRPTRRESGHFRLRIPVRASRRLVRDFFPNVEDL